MERYFGYTRQLSNPGQLVATATVNVYLAGTVTPATIYADNNLPNPTPKGNPFTTDANGFFEFYAQTGLYDVRLSGGLPAIPTPYTWGAVSLGVDGDCVNVRMYGAVGDGVTDDTAAFTAALTAANKRKPLYCPAGNYIVSNLVLQGTAAGGAETGDSWGLIGDGPGTTTITGKAGSVGVMVQFGASTDALAGYRRAYLRNLKIVGHSGYDEGVQIGHPGSGGDGVLVLPAIENVEVTGFTKASAGGIFFRNTVSPSLRRVYCYSNTNGLKCGTTTGAGVVTTVRCVDSQFRLNTNGVAMHACNGWYGDGNLYESNTAWGFLMMAFSASAQGIANVVEARPWAEANTSGSFKITSDNVPSVTQPANIEFIGGIYNKGTDGAIRIEDGDTITIHQPHFPGGAGSLVVTRVEIGRVFVITPPRFGGGQMAVPNDGVTIIEGLYSANPQIGGYQLRGKMIVTPRTTESGVEIESVDYGAAVKGPTVGVGRNSAAGNTSAGLLFLRDRNDTKRYIWSDAAGLLRTDTNAPPSIADTGGTVIGDQTSHSAAKHDLGIFADDAEALEAICATLLHRFTYKDGRYNGEEFIGPFVDETPIFGKDIDETGPRALNETTLFGYLIASIRELKRRIG